MMPGGARRGWIIPVGGGEKKARSSKILGRFVELCGGRDARIVVIPTASQMMDPGARYEKVFDELGAGLIESIPLERRADCADPAILGKIREATGVFMTGGNQLRLSTNLGGTEVARLLRRQNAEGLHVAGTSAGAAFLCEHMIASGAEGPTPRGGMVTLAPGLGLTNRVIIDQHFRERDRLGRLLTALAYNPFATGIGLDEDTAAFIGPDERIEVLGSGGLTIVDPTHIEHSSMDSAPKGRPVSLTGVRLHILVAGDCYNLETKEAEPASESG
jgi:cyanophycinase